MAEIERIILPKTKRILDITASILLLISSIPFWVFILLWIVLEQIFLPSSRGPLFYSEIRVSQGKPFKFYKFRIFKQDAIDKAIKHHPGCLHTKPLEKDPKNLTYYGKLLKKIYMDELPQLWIVLSGKMTLVGPRPTNLENSEKMKQTKNFTKEIMPCGITGPFQAEKGRGLNQRKTDEDYINFLKTKSTGKILINDLKILFRTVGTVFRAEGK